MSRPFFMHIHYIARHKGVQSGKNLRFLKFMKSLLFSYSSGGQRPTERGERMAQESTGSERTCGAAAWIIVE